MGNKQSALASNNDADIVKKEETGEKPKLSLWLRECPVEQETAEETEGEITGAVPEWLEGTLIRNGPGLYTFGDTEMRHTFDGMAMLHRFSISENGKKIVYQSKFLRSTDLEKNMKANRIVVGGFGTLSFPDPCQSAFGRFFNKFKGPEQKQDIDNCLVNVCTYGDSMYALTETALLRKISLDDLETQEKVDVSQFVAINHETAHPHIDTADGTVFNMGNGYDAQWPTYKIIASSVNKENPLADTKVVATIKAQNKWKPSYYHSFALTDNYIVFVEQPLVLNIRKIAMSHFTSTPYNECLEWLPQQKALIHVLKREDGAPVALKYTADAFFTFHHINAYEEDGMIVMDLCGYNNADVLPHLLRTRLKNPANNRITSYKCQGMRFVLPLALSQPEEGTTQETELRGAKATLQADDTIFCTPEILSPASYVELPRINYKLNGKKYKNYYAVCVKEAGIQSLSFNGIVKVDTETQEETFFDCAPGEDASEPVFVARPGSTEEDDGVVLVSLVNETENNFVALAILDAKDMTEVARVTFKAKGPVTKTFHGQFVGQEGIHLY